MAKSAGLNIFPKNLDQALKIEHAAASSIACSVKQDPTQTSRQLFSSHTHAIWWLSVGYLCSGWLRQAVRFKDNVSFFLLVMVSFIICLIFIRINRWAKKWFGCDIGGCCLFYLTSVWRVTIGVHLSHYQTCLVDFECWVSFGTFPLTPAMVPLSNDSLMALESLLISWNAWNGSVQF